MHFCTRNVAIFEFLISGWSFLGYGNSMGLKGHVGNPTELFIWLESMLYVMLPLNMDFWLASKMCIFLYKQTTLSKTFNVPKRADFVFPALTGKDRLNWNDFESPFQTYIVGMSRYRIYSEVDSSFPVNLLVLWLSILHSLFY